MAVIYIDIENAAGQKQGNGPITTAYRARSTTRMSKAGAFEFEMPASDPKAILIAKKRIARIYAVMNGQRIEMGAGIIDKIDNVAGNDGTAVLRVGGDDLVRELTYRTVKNLKLQSGGNPISHAAAVAAVEAYAPDGWSFTADGAPPNNNIYGNFNGETALSAVARVAQRSQNQFYRGAGRSIIFTSVFTPSGVRAVQARGRLTSATCAIKSFKQTINTYDEINRIYPRGSGNADVQLTLRATTRVAPAGYTLNAAENYIEYDAGVAELLIEQQVDFRDIGPISNTTADVVAASNALFDAALETLRRRSVELVQATISMEIEGCSQLLRPMQSIRAVYRNTLAELNINADYNILESTWQADRDGVQTTGLVVSNVDQWPKTDVGTIVDGIEDGNVYRALPQMNANGNTLTYLKNLDINHNATFRFRFGREVTQLQQVLFEFQLLPFESTVMSIGGASSGSGDLSTTAPDINDTGSGGNNDTGSTTPAINETTPTISTTTPTMGTTTPTIGTTTPTISGATLETNEPEGGDIESDGQHIHQINVIAGAGSLGPVDLHYSSGLDLYFLSNPFVTGSEPVYVSLSGDHTHEIGSHSHTIDTHSHTMAGHTHTMSGHTHTMSAHTHTMAGHTHTMNGHTHTLNNHIHDLSEALRPFYGIFRQTEANTMTLFQLEYQVNGGAWNDLDVDVDDAGDGWWALDITDHVYDPTAFTPLQTNNEIVIRNTVSSKSIAVWSENSGDLLVVCNHDFSVGTIIVISGSGVGDESGEDVDGLWTVTEASTTTSFQATGRTMTPLDNGTGGTAMAQLSVTIDAQLSIRHSIQAVAYA